MRLPLAAAALVLAACNSGQPRIYRIAIDLSSSNPVQDSSCWKNNNVPVSNVTEQNLYSEQQWVIWDSVASDTDPSPKQFLDFGQQKFQLGNSPAVDFSDLVGSTNSGQFTAQRAQSDTTRIGNGSIVQVRQTMLTAQFNDLGAAPAGSLVIDSRYACQALNGAQCPEEKDVNDPRSCRLVIPFSARRIDVARVTGYSETGSAKGSSSNPNL